MIGIETSERGGHHRPPVTALGTVACVPETVHKDRPHSGNPCRAPSQLGRRIAPAVPRERRADHIECVLWATSMANRIGEGSDYFLELHNGTRPPMSQKEREGLDSSIGRERNRFSGPRSWFETAGGDRAVLPGLASHSRYASSGKVSGPRAVAFPVTSRPPSQRLATLRQRACGAGPREHRNRPVF